MRSLLPESPLMHPSHDPRSAVELTCAVSRGDAASARRLIAEKDSWNIYRALDMTGRSALHACARSGDAEMLSILLDRAPSLALDEADSTGRSLSCILAHRMKQVMSTASPCRHQHWGGYGCQNSPPSCIF